MRVRKTSVEKEVVEDSSSASNEEQVASTVTEPKSTLFEVTHDEELAIVSFSFVDGTEIELREPMGMDFLKMESFAQAATEDYKSPSFLILKLAQLCIVKCGKSEKVGWDKWEAMLTKLDDIERVAAAIGRFSSVADYFERLKKRAIEAGLVLPGANV